VPSATAGWAVTPSETASRANRTKMFRDDFGVSCFVSFISELNGWNENELFTEIGF